MIEARYGREHLGVGIVSDQLGLAWCWCWWWLLGDLA